LFLGNLWCFERLFVRAPSGRQRLNVLSALDAVTHELVTTHNTKSVNAETVCYLLAKLRTTTTLPITLVLDNAKYQRCHLVEMLAKSMNIELLFLPPYSPNLNLIERFWGFVKRKCLYSRYYATFADFKKAILDVIEKAPTDYKEELASLLTLKFQVLQQVPLVPEGTEGMPELLVCPAPEEASLIAA